MKEAEDVVDRLTEGAGGEREPAIAESGDRLPTCFIARMDMACVAAASSRKEPQGPEAMIYGKLAKSISDSLVSCAEASAHEDKVGKFQLLQMGGNLLEIIVA